jgi:putative Mg2+ transporter-C (MgtC) family protein
MPELLNFDFTLLVRLVAAVILGALVGFERGGTKHDAGLRTHILLCLGAAAVMVVSEAVTRQYGISGEIMRMGAQVVSGVGFLGAGCIMVDGNRIRGITTAAGLWTTACVGLAVGAGYYIIAGFVVLLMLAVMYGLRNVARRLGARESRTDNLDEE